MRGVLLCTPQFTRDILMHLCAYGDILIYCLFYFSIILYFVLYYTPTTYVYHDALSGLEYSPFLFHSVLKHCYFLSDIAIITYSSYGLLIYDSL